MDIRVRRGSGADKEEDHEVYEGRQASRGTYRAVNRGRSLEMGSEASLEA